MSRKRVKPLQSSGKEKEDFDKKIALIIKNDLANREQIKGLNPNDEHDRKLASDFFKSKTESLRNEINTYISLNYSEEEALDRVLPEAYSVIRTAIKFLWDKKELYPVQLLGGILLNNGYAAQMATGEGKTLTASLPSYLNALLGKGVHVITPNGYLAQRDQKEMSELYELVGLTCGLIEERGKLSKEDIEQKTQEILDVKIKKYIENAKTPEEREKMIAAFFKDRKSKDAIEEARQEAIKALRQEEILKRREAYNCDITYGSSSAIAFDYLYDDIATDTSTMVQRPGLPNFAIVDEVDAVLFDDAITPFSLSGTQSDEELAISTEERKKIERNIDLINYAIKSIKSENDALIKRNRTVNQSDRLILKITDEHSFENLQYADTDKAYEYDMTRAIIIDKNTKEYKLTTLGETMIFKYFYGKEINKIMLENRDKIISMQYNGEPLYRDGYDYTINENGRLIMEPRSFAHLVMSGSIKELTELFNKFGSNELVSMHAEIDNAIRAWFILEENVDYKLSVPSEAKNLNERAITLVMNGRTAEGRVYSNGLQQAIEAKEKILKQSKFKIIPTEIKNTLASIPTASFFARYNKFSGMTGTAAVSAFNYLYGLETYEVPRNKKSNVKDLGERMYSSTEEKNDAIFREVLASYKKGQPVLLSTTSIEESEKLYNYLDMRFKELGYSVNIPVLNANVDKLEEEARIISKAGLPKAITISTEMAGRGTDIKLGGELPEVNEMIDIIKQERTDTLLSQLKAMNALNDSNKSYFLNKINQMLAMSSKSIEQEAITRLEKLKERKTQLEEEVIKAGGLKVIGSGHFSYSRVDDQVKGRCGRQGNPGEIVFFNDREDLIRIGVPKEKADELQKQAELAPIIEESDKKYTPIADIIYDAQSRTEEIVKLSIKQNQEIENEVSKYRKDLRAQKDALRESGDYVDAVKYMIEETVKTIILNSSNNDNPYITDRTRMSRANINLSNIISLTSEFLGIDLDIDQLRQIKMVGDLRTIITDLVLERYDDKNKELSYEEQNEKCKQKVDETINRIWTNFEEYVDDIKQQRMLNNTMQIQEIKVEPQISMVYAHSLESHRAMLVRDIINPEYKEKYQNNARSELVPIRITPDGPKRVESDYDKKMHIEEQKLILEANRSMRESRISIKANIFRLYNKAVLNRNNKDIGKGKLSNSEELESISFDNDNNMHNSSSKK